MNEYIYIYIYREREREREINEGRGDNKVTNTNDRSSITKIPAFIYSAVANARPKYLLAPNTRETL